MEKNNTPSFSICRKIRQALASNLAFRAIHRMKQHYQEPRPVIITHPPPQHVKVNTEKGGAIPIMFDHSTPASKVASPHVGISERTGKVATKVEPEPQNVLKQGKPKAETTGPLKFEQQGTKSLDINDTFTEYIQRARDRIRTVSNVGRGQNNSKPDHEANGTSGIINKMENQKDHFSDFIQQAKKKIRTTSNIGKTSSLKRA